ncbi:MAG: PrsW family intramembrane metalloprotease [Patescibacteria group bacterium]|nr:PrsW family intramembrane metalloprotease [Patescibacteria group bacterium]MDE2173114.1 PrsW family intramembrane metalloprotease [Patescibacteria group bacterium]
MTFTTLGYALLGGLLPSFIWLYFLLKEDARCPEPRALIALAFVAGMLAIPLALPLEQYAKMHLTGTVSVLTAWATIEEVLKYVMAVVFILWRRAVDEAPDYVIYMITVALGFAAAENMLFLLAPLSGGHFADGVFTGDLRFLGSTLLHVIASATIGFAFAFSAQSRPIIRVAAAALGLILAIALHTCFNMLIIRQGASFALAAFFLVWMVAVIFFAAFEVLKYIQYRNIPNNTC